MDGIEIQDLYKSYQVDGRTLNVLQGISLKIPENRITVILGRSGCGKTTLLRLTGGLEQPDSGRILSASEQKEQEIKDIVETVSLTGFEKAYPSQLSGGMQQRVSIARALAYRPSFILMDEPFAALDYFTREQMQKELRRVQRQTGCSILFVTHSIDEALLLGHQIVVIENGRVKAQYEIPETGEERSLLEDGFIALKKSVINQLNIE